MSATPVFPPIGPDDRPAVDTDDQKSGVHPSAKLEVFAGLMVDPGSTVNDTSTDDAITRRNLTREAERSLHVRTQFLRRVAHDIASPTGVAMTVLEEIASESNRPDLVTMARRALRRLLRLSEQLALASDLEAGDVVPDTTVEDIGTIVKEALDSAVAIDGRRDIVTSCGVPDGRIVVDVDRRLVMSLLREVIGNALKLACSRVTVDVERVGASTFESAEQPVLGRGIGQDDASETVLSSARVEIRVQDDGSGFPEESLETLGERFSPRSCTRGLGLSLSMAREILAAHGGDLRVETSALPLSRRKTRGAAVVISLPVV